ncbi:MAG: PDZ domain-containing protein [Candidatus Aminicenantales bacterium]
MFQLHFRSWAIGSALLLSAGLLSASPAAGSIDEQKIENILKTTSLSVVKVEARNGVRKIATGVVLDKDGTIVTTALISPREEEITVLTTDGKKFKADFKGFDLQTGLAVIQVKEKGLIPILLGTPADARPGAWIGVIGFSPENTPSVSQGIVSSTAEDRIRLNLWVMPGASGSPIVNAEGRLIGVLRGTYVDDQPLFFEFRERQVVGAGTVYSRAEAPSSGMALAVPVDIVQAVVNDIRKTGKVMRGWLGVTILETEGRLEIEEIVPKSPADQANLKKGDVVVKVDGREVSVGLVVSREIRRRKPGSEVTFGILRDGAAKDVKVKVGEFTEADGRRELEDRFPGLFPPPPGGAGRPRMPGMPEEFFNRENRKHIGVSLQELGKDLAAYFGVPEGRGLLVTEFAPDSPAQKAGLKIGDVILKADGRALDSVIDLSDIIRNKKTGEKIRLDILRDKKSMSVEVPVVEQVNRLAGPNRTVESLRDYRNRLEDRNWLSEIPESMMRLFIDFNKDGTAFSRICGF